MNGLRKWAIWFLWWPVVLSIPTKDRNAQNFLNTSDWAMEIFEMLFSLTWMIFILSFWVPVRGRDPKCFHQVSTGGHKEAIDDTLSIAEGGVVLKCFGSLPIILYWIMQCRGEFLFVQRCMSFTEKIVVGKFSVKVMHSGKVMLDCTWFLRKFP